MHSSDPVRRLCAAVTSHGAADGAPHRRARPRLADTLRRTCLAAGLEELFLQEQSPVDAAEPATVLLVMPAGMNEPRVITDLVARLEDTVARSAAAGRTGLRLAIAFDQGITRLTADGVFEGRVVTEVRRLSTAEPARAALVGGSGVAVVIAAPLLDDLAPPGPDGRDRSHFREMTVDLSGRRIRAWLRPPGRAFRILDQA